MPEHLTDIKRYRKLCNENKTIPLFMQAWWMDVVCFKEKWDVILYEKKNRIVAVWVYHYVTKLGFKIIIQPQLTQTNGIWIDRTINLSKNEVINFDNEVMKFLIDQIHKRKFSYYDQNFHHSITNWLPLYWNGFQQTTRYTYQILDISDTADCYENFSYAKKKQIKKAEKTIKIEFNLNSELFYEHLVKNFKTFGQNVYYKKDFFLRLFQACKNRNQGCIISAFDEQKCFHAALFIVWDENTAYNLISAINPEFRSSGASTLIVWEAIKYMSSKTKIFDFEGSMNKNIENSFRQFGTVQIPYFRIRKFNSIPFRILYQIKKWI